jgi:hypothetical protein
MEKQGNFRREISMPHADLLAKTINQLFGMAVGAEHIQAIAKLIIEIENKIDGRIAGDIEDYIFNYFLQKHTASIQAENTDLQHIEIGTLFGGSLILALLACKEANSNHTVLGIDPLDGYYRMDRLRGKETDIITDIPITREILTTNLKRFGFNPDKYHFLQKYSTDPSIQQDVRTLSIITLFIDGDHSYDGIKNDWELFNPHVIPGGYVLIDNYNDHLWPEVSDYIHQEVLPFTNEWEVLFILNRSLLLQKRKPSGLHNQIAHHCYQRRYWHIEKLLKEFDKMKVTLIKTKELVVKKNLEKKQLSDELIAIKNSRSYKIMAKLKSIVYKKGNH